MSTTSAPVDLTGAIQLRRDLKRVGLTDRHIAHMVASRVLRRVRRGAYVDEQLWQSLSAADRHRLLTRAVMLTGQAGTVATHVSAAVEWGAPVWDLPLDVAHTTRHDSTAGRRRDDWAQHAGVLPQHHVVMRNGVPVSSAARTCVEVTTVADVERSLVVVNGLLHAGATTAAEFGAMAQDCRYWPYSLHTDLVLRLCSDKLESPGETRFDYFCFRQHLPRPEPQVTVYDERGRRFARVDFAWLGHGVFVEFDGRLKYEAHRREGETLEEFLMREKRREETICQLTGWVCIRVTWADLANPELLARRIRRLLESRRPSVS
jgi:hypothetical protein